MDESAGKPRGAADGPETSQEAGAAKSSGGWEARIDDPASQEPGTSEAGESTEVLAAGTPGNEPDGLVTASGHNRILLSVSCG